MKASSIISKQILCLLYNLFYSWTMVIFRATVHIFFFFLHLNIQVENNVDVMGQVTLIVRATGSSDLSRTCCWYSVHAFGANGTIYF
jgi:hypothetical protein